MLLLGTEAPPSLSVIAGGRSPGSDGMGERPSKSAELQSSHTGETREDSKPRNSAATRYMCWGIDVDPDATVKFLCYCILSLSHTLIQSTACNYTHIT